MAARSDTAYLDSNANTLMSSDTIAVMVNWFNRGNSSARYKSAEDARSLIQAFRNELAAYISPDFRYVFTSGASESNAQILRGVSLLYRKKTGRTPHIVSSAAEHKSILLCLEQLQEYGLATYTLVSSSPSMHGAASVEDVKNAITPNTCLISIMAANNETGALNNLPKLYELARSANIPYHTDAVQLFGKMPGLCANSDAFSVSFHKLRGPIGCGMLAIRESAFPGVGAGKFPALVCGTQNEGLRGGTHNMPAVAASYAAFRECMTGPDGKSGVLSRARKNALMARRRYALIDSLSAIVDKNIFVFGLDALPSPPPPVYIWILSPVHSSGLACLPNTLMISLMKPGLCNRMIIERLLAKKIIISAGSACNTTDPNISHVLKAMKVPVDIAKSSVRISFDDSTCGSDEIFARLVAAFREIVVD